MYIDLIVLILIVVAIIFYFRSFSSFVYLLCSLDILYKLLHFISSNVDIPKLNNLIDKYVPSSLLGLFGNYVGTEGFLFLIIKWAIFVLYSIFLFYIIRILIRRR